jgi:glycosyltransferase involved in cell wall biosynthesis
VSDRLEVAARESALAAVREAGAQVERFTLAARRVPAPADGVAVRHLFGWSAPRALRRALARSGEFDLLHTCSTATARIAARARPDLPLLIEYDGEALLAGEPAEELTLAAVVVVPSTGVAHAAQAAGARVALVVAPGCAGPVGGHAPWPDPPRLVSAAPLVGRQRHGDVLRTLAVLGDRYPTLRYDVIGEGPEREALGALAERLGVQARIDWHGPLEADAARERLGAATILAMPSVDEPFGVAYIEAMAAGVPAIGCRGEPGPEEIAAAGDGITLVPPGDIERLSQRIDELLGDPARLREASMRARATAAEHFSLAQHAELMLAAYGAAAAR